MRQSLLLTCNSRSATISMHRYGIDSGEVVQFDDVALPVYGEAQASPMAFNANRSLVYVAWRGTAKRLFTFALGRSRLLLVHEHVLAEDLCFLHPGLGDTLVGAGGSQAFQYRLDREGFPSSTLRTLPVGEMAHCAVADATGRVFTAACRGDLIRCFYEEKLLFEAPQPHGSGPRHLCLSPDRKHLFLVTQESGEVVSFSTDGGLEEISRHKMVDTATQPMGGDIVITPDGRFVYATERSTNAVVGFAVDPGGALHRIGASQTPDYPRALCMDGDGRFLVALGFRGHQANIYAIGNDGRLTQTAAFATGERPSWMIAVEET